MFNLKSKILWVVVLAFQLNVFADPPPDRITVTVHGQGPDILLIPGLTCSGGVWDATVANFQMRYRLHVIQVDGFAGTKAQGNADGPVVQPIVDVIDAYIKANKLQSPKVIGHSLGGTIGMLLALQHPDDVGALMIVDALPFSGLLIGANDALSATNKAAEMRDKTLKESQEHYARDEKKFLRILVKSDDARKMATEWAITSDKSVVARATYDDMTIDIRPQLQNIKIPVTILYPWDSNSPYSQSQTDSFYEQNYAALPNKKFARIDNSYHFIMLDQPDAFLVQVEKFVASP